jgi:hypothetical protein
MEKLKTPSNCCLGSGVHARPPVESRRKGLQPFGVLGLWMSILLYFGWTTPLAGQNIPCEFFDSAGTAGKYHELIALSNGDFLACGEMPDGQGFLARFDAQMDPVWRRGYQFGSGATRLFDVVENSQGELVAAGSCAGWTPGMPRRGMLLYVDGNGAMLSTTPIFVSSDSGEIWAIENALDGSGYIVAEMHAIPFFHEAWITLVDDTFAVTWSTKCDGYGQYTHLHDVAAVPGWGYYASGITGNAFHDNRLSYWRLDSIGGIQWERAYVSDTIDLPHVGYSLAWDASSSTLVLGGTVYVDAALGNEYCLLRIDPGTGVRLDSAFGGLGQDDRLLKVRVDANGTIYGAGYTSGGFWFGLTESDATVMVFDSNLQMFSIERWEDPLDPDDAWVIEGLALDPMSVGCYNWAGHRSGTLRGAAHFGGCSAPCTVSIDDPLGIAFSLSPNPPVSGAPVRLRWDQGLNSEGRVEVFGTDGKLVHAQTFGSGLEEISFPAPDVAGIYLVQIRAGSKGTTRRLMVTHL